MEISDNFMFQMQISNIWRKAAGLSGGEDAKGRGIKRGGGTISG